MDLDLQNRNNAILVVDTTGQTKKSINLQVDVLAGNLLTFIEKKEIEGKIEYVFKALDVCTYYIYVTCSSNEFRNISLMERDLLRSIPTCEKRLKVFADREWLNYGSRLQVGDQVFVKLKGKYRELPGVLRFKGSDVPDSEGIYFGVELKDKQGSSDGSFRRKRFFKTEQDCAVFVSLSRIQRRWDSWHKSTRSQVEIFYQQQENVVQCNLRLGERVVWVNDEGPEKGTVQWIGRLSDEPGDNITVGVAFDNPIGSGMDKYKDELLFYAKQSNTALIPLVLLTKEEEFVPPGSSDTTNVTSPELIKQQKSLPDQITNSAFNREQGTIQRLSGSNQTMLAGTDMNQEIISMNLDMMEKQRHHMHSVLDDYVDQVITAGRQWTRSVERNQSSFLKVHKIITKAMEFLSLKCEEMKREHFSCLQQETSNLIRKDEFTQQQKQGLMDSGVDNTGDFSVAEPMTMNRESTEDDSHNARNPRTSREPNLESAQRARNEDFYNQLQNILAKQDGLDQQANIKFNELREEMESLKLNVDQINTDLSAKVEANSVLSGKVHDQISVVLETLSNREHESAAQVNKIVDLENHFNTVEKDMQNNVRQVENKLDEVGTNYTMIRELFVRRLAPLEKLQDILNERATSQSENIRQLQAVMAELKDLSNVVKTGARKSEAEVRFHAEMMFSTTHWERSCVCPFQSPRLISGCQFDSTTGKFTAVVDGFFLVYINLCITHDGFATIYLMHGNKSQEHSVEICSAKAETRHIPVFYIAMVEMKVDDELFMMIDGRSLFWSLDRNSPLNCAIQFSCLRFG